METLAELIERVISSEPMERRLYPDLYSQKVADEIERSGFTSGPTA